MENKAPIVIEKASIILAGLLVAIFGIFVFLCYLLFGRSEQKKAAIISITRKRDEEAAEAKKLADAEAAKKAADAEAAKKAADAETAKKLADEAAQKTGQTA